MIHAERPWNDDDLIRTGISNIVKLPFVSKAPISEADRYHERITKAFMSTAMARNVAVQGLDSDPLPSRFELYQNWPNPFNPFTNIEFYLEGDAANGAEHVQLSVFNILGQMIRTLVDQPLPPGVHQYVWDGTDDSGERMASGVYLYRLLVGMDSQAKKMILVK